ncbi:MAG TPA: hypothetical protein V6C97_00780 [Oculatellaceae cyanobacterium]
MESDEAREKYKAGIARRRCVRGEPEADDDEEDEELEAEEEPVITDKEQESQRGRCASSCTKEALTLRGGCGRRRRPHAEGGALRSRKREHEGERHAAKEHS